MEPLAPLSYMFVKQKKLVQFAQFLANNFTINWKELPFVQKYYGFVRQIFVKKICATGHSAYLAFDYINQIKKYYQNGNLEDVVNLDFLRQIDPDFMFIE